MTADGGRLEMDLRRYLKDRRMLLSPHIHEVVSEVSTFMTAVQQKGFPAAVALSRSDLEAGLSRPFVETCDAIIAHHLRAVGEADRPIISKSLFEAYIYFAGAQYAFEPAKKTRLILSLRRRGTRGFIELFLSLYLFNVVSLEIQDDVGGAMRDLKSFELYMLGIEAVCRDVVARAMKVYGAEPDAHWAAAIRITIEKQLLS